MGTNYYLKRIPSITEKDEAKRLIDEDKLYEAIQLLEAIDTNEVHICKKSFGWQVLFDHNWGKFYSPNRKCIDMFIRESGFYICDEYGERISVDDFWKMVDEWNANPDNKWTARSYEEYEKSKDEFWNCYHLIEDRKKCFEKFGIHCDDDDFIVDGLRFSVGSDFC